MLADLSSPLHRPPEEGAKQFQGYGFSSWSIPTLTGIPSITVPRKFPGASGWMELNDFSWSVRVSLRRHRCSGATSYLR